MAQTTTNFGFPFPEVGDSTTSIINSTATAIIEIDEELQSLATQIGLTTGKGLEVVANELRAKLGFGLSFDPSTDAIRVDSASLVINPIFSTLGVPFQAVFDSNVSLENYGASNFDIVFTPQSPYKPISIQLSEDAAGNAVTVARVSFGESAADNPQYGFIIHAEDKHFSSTTSVKNAPTLLTGIAASDVQKFKLLYYGNGDRFILLIQRTSTGSIEIWNINQADYTVAPTQTATTITGTLDNWDAVIYLDRLFIVCISTGTLKPQVYSIDLTGPVITGPFNLFSASPYLGAAIEIVCSVDDSGFVTTWCLESGAPPQLHRYSFVYTAPGAPIGETQTPQSIMGPFRAASHVTHSFMSAISTIDGLIRIFSADSTVPGTDAEAIIDTFRAGTIWGFVRTSTNDLVVTYWAKVGSVTQEMTYTVITPNTPFTTTQTITTSANITSTDISRNLYLSDINRFVSNIIFSTNASPSIGMAFYIIDHNYVRGSVSIMRNLVAIGSTQYEDDLPQRWPIGVWALFDKNPRTTIKVTFPAGASYTVSGWQNDFIAFVRFQDTPELLTGTVNVYTRDITLNNIATDINTGVIFQSLSTYVHNSNDVILWVRSDGRIKTGRGPIETGALLLGNGDIIAPGGMYDASPESVQGLGITGSGSLQRVNAGDWLTFDTLERLTPILAEVGNDTSSEILIDNIGFSYVDSGLNPGYTTDTTSVFREIVNGPDITPTSSGNPVRLVFRLAGNPTLLGINNVIIYQPTDNTVPVPPTPNDPDAALTIVPGTAILVPVASSQADGADTLVFTEPVNWNPQNNEVWVVQYQITRPTAATPISLFQWSPGNLTYRALAGGSVLPSDTDWGSPTPAPGFYRFYPGPPFVAGVSPDGILDNPLGMIQRIETPAVSTSKLQGLILSDSNGVIPQANFPPYLSGDHNDLNAIQGGTTTERYHLDLTQFTVLTSSGGVANADLQHSHDHNTTTGIQGGSAGNYNHITTTQRLALTSDGGVVNASTEHIHDDRYYTETEINTLLSPLGSAYDEASAIDTDTAVLPIIAGSGTFTHTFTLTFAGSTFNGLRRMGIVRVRLAPAASIGLSIARISLGGNSGIGNETNFGSFIGTPPFVGDGESPRNRYVDLTYVEFVPGNTSLSVDVIVENSQNVATIAAGTLVAALMSAF